MTEERQ